MPRTTQLFVVFAMSLGAVEPSAAQWIKHPTPGIPRTADGQVDLKAPAPRTADGRPDLSGMWGWQPGKYFGALWADLGPDSLQPWALELVKQRAEHMGKDDPANFDCVPQGPRMNLHAPLPVKFVQTPGLLIILSEDMSYRQIFLDGRALPKDPDPSFMGYSVGRWEEDTLVVETIGFKDRTWLDFAGTPHTEQLRVTERIRRTAFGHLDIAQTVDDPGVFKTPFTVTLGAHFVADTELLEFVCAENERSRRHFTGTTSELVKEHLDRAIEVPAAIIEKYAGTYDWRIPENPSTPHLFELRVVDGRLVMPGGPPLIALSETEFFGGFGVFTVMRDERGRATELRLRAAEGELRAIRLPDVR
jgi:hypothetical protein